ncbi:ABC transporter substrate-binding protein [Paenibacillus oceani]|uniref:Extracellular solute-binding protein n=1 Tax=Paenibacillus oceani TaxID=2772510 RepID=A0A927CCE0_9BACL|nr:extracellular solute-binding protein [Paenibacillus oceani]MBD2864098.1 extracellular solute-binding protein [Paenibacillus oceani]
MIKRYGTALSASVLLLSVLSACGGSGTAENGANGSKDGTGEGAAPAAPKQEESWADKPAELVFHNLAGGAEEQFNNTYGNLIRKKFPNYTIKFIQSKPGTTLPELVAVKERVDIVYNTIEYIAEPLLGTGLEYDMTELIKKHNVDLNRFEPTIIDGIRGMAGGKIYMLPITNMRQVLFYNKGVFDKLGVAYPKNGMTWDDAFELSKKLTRSEGGINYLGLSASPAHILRTNQLSKPYLDPKTMKPTFMDEEWKKLLQTYFLSYGQVESFASRTAELKRLPYYTEMTNTYELAMFVFNSQFPWDGASAVKNIDWDLVSMPTFKDKPKVGSQSSPFSFAITSIAKDKDAAMEVIKYLTSDETQTEFSKNGLMPVLKSDAVKKVYGTASQYKDKNWSAVYYDAFAPLSYKSIYELGIERQYAPLMADIATGKVDLNTGLRNIQELAEKYIAEQQKK